MAQTKSSTFWRILRLLAIATAPVVVAIEIVRPGFAQLPPVNPLVVPAPPPSPPAQLPAPITTAVAPPVMAVPTLPSAYATPGPRVFNCSCFGTVGTRWMGQVTASSYFNARQSAGGACMSYTQGKLPTVGAAGGVGAANRYVPLPGANQPAGAANNYPAVPSISQNVGAANNYPAVSNYGPVPSVLTAASAMCSQCTCD
jgi:hypothetical protein